MPELEVRAAQESDIPAWRTLAAEVDALFGANMSESQEFRAALQRNIARGSAYCVWIHGELAGAMLYRNGWIHWLAVGKRFQRQGIGRALVQHALELDETKLGVITFGDGHPHPDSAGAQSFYEAMGFEIVDESFTHSLDGTPRILMRWRKETD